MIKVSNIVKSAIGLVLMIAMIIFVNMYRYLFGAGVEFKGSELNILYVLSVGVFVLLLIDRRLIGETVYKILSAVSVLSVPFIMMQISMILSGDIEYTFSIYMMNTLLYFMPIVIMYIITNSLPVSATVAVIIGSGFNITSYVLNVLRGTPFIPTDILAIRTAMKIAATYEFSMKWPLVSAIIISVFSLVFIWSFPLKIKFKHSALICRGGAAAIFMAVVISFSNINFQDIYIDLFDQVHANNTHGTAYSFFINCCKMKLEKPDGYNEKDVLAMLDTLEDNTPVSEDKPNVVVIMNESYADLKKVGDFRTNIPYNSFVSSLKDNTISGELLVSPFGGYTCNTEFELLSGLSMGLLPAGGTPYLQHINKRYPHFMPEYMKSLGYSTVALHPYYARCWNRETVYPLLGFDKFISLDNFEEYYDQEIENVRSYVSDKTSYKALIKQLEDKGDDERLFLFNITMQNHGGYTYGDPDFTNIVRITNMRGDYPQAEQYLSLIKRSDDAFKMLINYLKGFDEPTVVVMFGDHFPGIEQGFYEELYGKSINELNAEEMLRRYTVPFVIWTNYEQESRSGVQTSINYLSDLIYESAGLPKSKISVFHDKIKDKVPLINGMGHYDINRVWQSNNSDTSQAINDYAKLEYFMLTHKF